MSDENNTAVITVTSTRYMRLGDFYYLTTHNKSKKLRDYIIAFILRRPVKTTRTKYKYFVRKIISETQVLLEVDQSESKQP